MAVLIIFPVILQTVISLRMLFIGGQGKGWDLCRSCYWSLKGNCIIGF